MAATARVTANEHMHDDGPDFTENSNWGGLLSFLAAGAVLFASLIIGSSASLVFAGDNELIAAILEGFLELGLWTFAGFLAAVGFALAVNRCRA